MVEALQGDRTLVIARAMRGVGGVGLLVLGLVLAGCGGGRSVVQGSPVFTIKMNDKLRFVPDRLVVARGTVRLRLQNVGSLPHNIDIPRLGIVSPTIVGGQSTTITVHVPKKGSYPFDCNIHVMDGMVGTLVVR